MATRGFPFPSDPAALPLRAAYPQAGLQVKRGEVVGVAEAGEPWWIGGVISVRGSPKDPTAPDFIQVINVEPVGWIPEQCSTCVKTKVCWQQTADSPSIKWKSVCGTHADCGLRTQVVSGCTIIEAITLKQ
jgi:hypothetical protein